AIPIAGNTFLTEKGGEDKISSQGIDKWRSPQSVVSTFFHINIAGKVRLKLEIDQQALDSELSVEVNHQINSVLIPKGEARQIDLGEFELRRGYNKISFKGKHTGSKDFAVLRFLLILPIEERMEATFVEENGDNRFYWGRRGPSVHLSYEIPHDRNFQWFYSEITVPEGDDPVGSYYMANGFAEGYFGIQVNSDTERRVLFSVWSPYHTADPSKIPEEQRIQLIKKGEGVYTGEFGNEGSGGQSYLVYPWKSGNTYSFLNAVTPDGKGNTIYTAYFYAPEEGKWKLIASFLRPHTITWYKRPHAFLENFLDYNGFKVRKAYYANQWIRDTEGIWVELNKATFTADDIGRRGYRKDLAGGVEEGAFFLENGGFFNGLVEIGSVFTRPQKRNFPEIDFSLLQ